MPALFKGVTGVVVMKVFVAPLVVVTVGWLVGGVLGGSVPQRAMGGPVS